MIFGNKERILYGNRFNGTNGNGYQPIKKEMTNEEWFAGLSTKEKALFLGRFAEIYFDRIDCSVLGALEEAQEGKEEIFDRTKDLIVEWLKAVHK